VLKKTQHEEITKLDAPLCFKKFKIRQFKSEDIITNKNITTDTWEKM